MLYGHFISLIWNFLKTLSRKSPNCSPSAKLVTKPFCQSGSVDLICLRYAGRRKRWTQQVFAELVSETPTAVAEYICMLVGTQFRLSKFKNNSAPKPLGISLGLRFQVRSIISALLLSHGVARRLMTTTTTTTTTWADDNWLTAGDATASSRVCIVSVRENSIPRGFARYAVARSRQILHRFLSIKKILLLYQWSFGSKLGPYSL